MPGYYSATLMLNGKKIVIVLPAYRAALTLGTHL